MVRFDGQVVLVTGAGRGLGRAYAELLARLGAYVIVHDAGVASDGTGGDPRVAEEAARAICATGGSARALAGDLGLRTACEDAVSAAVDWFGRLDSLVHSAGLVLRAQLDDAGDIWARSAAVNIGSAFWLCRAAVPVMRRQRYGRIVLTTSGYGLGPADDVDDLAAYCAAKAAQFGLMNGLAFAAADGVLVNAVAPVAATRIFSRAVEPGELIPEQVAPGVALLASRACRVSGVVLSAAGGRFSTWHGVRSKGIDAGAEPVSPDTLIARWSEIAD